MLYKYAILPPVWSVKQKLLNPPKFHKIMKFDYDLEIEKAVKKIKQEKAEKVLIQLPDGLKPKAKEIKETIEKETEAEIIIWLGSCFGACDFPMNIQKDIDLLIAWGHAEWRF